jgi:hypothetical protein
MNARAAQLLLHLFVCILMIMISAVLGEDLNDFASGDE